MSVEVNGIAHVQLTVNDSARCVPFWEKLCHFLGMQTLIRGEDVVYCIGGRTGVLVRGAPPGTAAGWGPAGRAPRAATGARACRGPELSPSRRRARGRVHAELPRGPGGEAVLLPVRAASGRAVAEHEGRPSARHHPRRPRARPAAVTRRRGFSACV